MNQPPLSEKEADARRLQRMEDVEERIGYADASRLGLSVEDINRMDQRNRDWDKKMETSLGS